MSNVTTVKNNLPAASNYVTQMLNSIKEDFLAVNEDMDFDFVNIGTWLNISKKGNFVEKDSNDTVVEDYSDSIDVVVGYGEKRWTLWGKQESPEEGQLIVAKRDKEEAEQDLQVFLQENPEAQTRYDLKSLELRYIAYIVPVTTLNPDGFPKIYLMSFPSTTTIQWGRYAQGIYLGKGAKALVPPRTGVNRVVTRMTTSEKGSGEKSWIGIDFEPVGLFDPRDYGIKADQTAPAKDAPIVSKTPNPAETVAAGADPY
ncbi:hypothetical protein HSX37_16335|uniref:Phage protein n=1 Tax=Dendrosporobacter quercicolus TaxID=146817 RepID=A0A1G9ZVB5_9FIRM|nr:hypothetical protein [Dendrosporobacter quercicolus]NSL49605.1 hypothetical protein [Dendrosporobacter quercicolus DSM 1736]SDN24623.1 hypothetical protein SAMN04488502_11561 [Dendrosporobacter quercicolus]